MTTTTERPPCTPNPIFIEDEESIATTSISSDKTVPPATPPSIVLRPAKTVEPGALEKLFWGVSDQVPVFFGYVLHIEISLEQLGFPSDAIASESPWPSFWTQPQSSYRSRPGVLFFSHDRPTIFEQSMVIHTASLPWWKPQITLSSRLLGKRDD